jgi:hypothetical protein
MDGHDIDENFHLTQSQAAEAVEINQSQSRILRFANFVERVIRSRYVIIPSKVGKTVNLNCFYNV